MIQKKLKPTLYYPYNILLGMLQNCYFLPPFFVHTLPINCKGGIRHA